MRNLRRALTKTLFCGAAALILSAEILIAQSEPKPPVEKTESTQPGTTPGFHENIGIVSDTQGVNFDPYVSSVFKTIHAHWLELTPDASLLRKQEANVTIEFSITRDGKLEDLKFLTNSGEALLDRAAQAGILASSPFPPLPAEFKGPSIRLRLNFEYRPWTSVNIDSGPSDKETSRGAAPATRENRGQKGSIEILSETQGIDLGPYLQLVRDEVRKNWFAHITGDSETKKGELAIELKIVKDGAVAGMKLVVTSGNVSLDQAAWTGIVASDPFPPLPSVYTAPSLALRLRFHYNPDEANRKDLNPAPTSGSHPPLTVPSAIIHAVPIADISNTNTPKYSKEARTEKIEGTVVLHVSIDTKGTVKSVFTTMGNPVLLEAAASAIRKWRFYPAQRDGKPVEDMATIKVDFRLDGEQVQAIVDTPELPPNPVR